MPFEMHPLLRWRMAAAAENHKDIDTGSGGSIGAVPASHGRRSTSSDRGALSAREITGAGASRGGWWGWSDGKRAVEALFAAGKVAAAGRRGFERIYNLPERVIPARVLAMPTPAIEDAQRALMRIAASALGVGTGKRSLRLLPHPLDSGQAAHHGTRRDRGTDTGRRRRMAGAGVRTSRCEVAAQARCGRPALLRSTR